jgi:hypothetical protein
MTWPELCCVDLLVAGHVAPPIDGPVLLANEMADGPTDRRFRAASLGVGIPLSFASGGSNVSGAANRSTHREN